MFAYGKICILAAICFVLYRGHAVPESDGMNWDACGERFVAFGGQGELTVIERRGSLARYEHYFENELLQSVDLPRIEFRSFHTGHPNRFFTIHGGGFVFLDISDNFRFHGLVLAGVGSRRSVTRIPVPENTDFIVDTILAKEQWHFRHGTYWIVALGPMNAREFMIIDLDRSIAEHQVSFKLESLASFFGFALSNTGTVSESIQVIRLTASGLELILVFDGKEVAKFYEFSQYFPIEGNRIPDDILETNTKDIVGVVLGKSRLSKRFMVRGYVSNDGQFVAAANPEATEFDDFQYDSRTRSLLWIVRKEQEQRFSSFLGERFEEELNHIFLHGHGDLYFMDSTEDFSKVLIFHTLYGFPDSEKIFIVENTSGSTNTILLCGET